MSSRNLQRLAFIALLLSVAAGAFLWSFDMERKALASAARCDRGFEQTSEKIDCWLRIIRGIVEEAGVAPALKVFSSLYDLYPAFAATGCHSYAHKVGDMAYYGLYRPDPDLARMDFPQSTTACGYGFFHGFLEHLIQDNPHVSFVTETCEYLKGRLGNSMRDIGTICYHGSGHGFTLAQIDVVPQSAWGGVRAFIDEPMRACESLPEANEAETEDCREGIFNVIADWMINREYGFAFDAEDPFDICRGLPSRWLYSCYYEVGQKTRPLFRDDPVLAAALVAGVPESFRSMTFGVMIAGVMQERTALDGASSLFQECGEIKDRGLLEQCVHSIANGMMEHGSPGKEYERVLAFCGSEELSDGDLRSLCYRTLARRLMRFYERAMSESICKAFPETEHDTCLSELDYVPNKRSSS